MLKLFKIVFRKEICQIDIAKIKDAAYRETVFMEFTLKKRAISCLKVLLQHVNL